MGGVLGGLRVVDLSALFAAPQIGALLADLGADVVKVEPSSGDPLTGLGNQRNGRSLPYILANRGKRVLTLDSAVENEGTVIERLLAACDVLVTNQPRRQLERWKCTPEETAARFPQLVHVTVSCYGFSGPLRDVGGNGSMAEAFGGLTFLTGEPDGDPTLPSVPLGDSLVALSGALGAVSACWNRSVAGGRGQHVDVSMYEPVLMLLGSALASWQPGEDPPQRTGSRVEGGAPRNVYRGSDGRFLVVSGTTDAQVSRVLQLMEVESPDQLARFSKSSDRVQHADELDEMVAAWIAGRTRDAALEAFAAVRVPAAPVHDLADLASHPQVVHRGSLGSVTDPVAGSVTVPGVPFHFGGSPPMARTAPQAAASPHQLLAEWEA